jgi:hypothetical protein
MTGQPQEPTWQPVGQDQGLTQGRPAWQTPSYTPPAGSPPDAPPYPPYGQQPAQGYGAPTYAAADQAYADQPYAAGQDQGYQEQAYQAPGYPAQPGQHGRHGQDSAPGWQALAGMSQAGARARQQGEKGFLGSLFDFTFTSMVTPRIIKALYVLAVLWASFIALAYVIIGFKFGGFGGGLAVLVLIAPIILLLTVGVSRVVLEAFMVAFRMLDELKAIREQNENRT